MSVIEQRAYKFKLSEVKHPEEDMNGLTRTATFTWSVVSPFDIFDALDIALETLTVLVSCTNGKEEQNSVSFAQSYAIRSRTNGAPVFDEK